MWDDPLGRQPGEALDPERHSVSQLLIRAAGNPRMNAAMWQQSPRPSGGNLINIEKFNKINLSEVPTEGIIKARAYDLAFSEKEVVKAKPDYTASCLMGLWQDGDNYAFYIYNITRWQRSWPDTKRKMKDIGLADTPSVSIILEGGGAQKGLGESLRDEKDFAPFTISIIPPVADKVARAQYWIDKLDIGKIYLVIDPANKDFLTECESFPLGVNDDQVDAVSLVFWYLMELLKTPSVTSVRVKGLYGRKK